MRNQHTIGRITPQRVHTRGWALEDETRMRACLMRLLVPAAQVATISLLHSLRISFCPSHLLRTSIGL